MADASQIFQAAADLAEKSGDETWFEMLENAGMILASLGRYGEALPLMTKAYKASLDDERIDEEQRRFSRGKLEVTRYGLYIQENKSDIDSWKRLEYSLENAAIQCRKYDSLISSVFELDLARLGVYKMLGYKILSKKIHRDLLDLAKDIMGENPTTEYIESELLPNHHPAIRDLAEKIYLEVIDSSANDISEKYS